LLAINDSLFSPAAAASAQNKNDLAAMLTNASPEKQTQMLGERLYMLINLIDFFLFNAGQRRETARAGIGRITTLLGGSDLVRFGVGHGGLKGWGGIFPFMLHCESAKKRKACKPAQTPSQGMKQKKRK